MDYDSEFGVTRASEPDLTDAELVEAEIRAAEIVSTLGPDDGRGISWIVDEEKEFLDDIAAASSIGDGTDDGTRPRPPRARAARRSSDPARQRAHVGSRRGPAYFRCE